ncbi:MAG: TlpA disulfide reductase family protein [Agriterribacter sp.]
MKQFFCLLALLWVNISNAQANNNIKPLHIGDAIPAGIQLTGITNFPVSKIQLSDYNSKLLILDFWATWCSSCIQQFPKITALAKEFEGKAQFLLVPHSNTVADSAGVMHFFAARNAAYRLPSLTRDSILLKMFPHQAIPHYVWVNNGTVIAITDAAAITAKNILSALNDLPMNTNEKKDRNYDADSSLFGNAGSEATDALKTSFNLTGHLTGYVSMSGYSETNGLIKRYTINSPLLSLYSMAFSELGYFAANRVIWNVKNRYELLPDYPNWDTWKLKHTYCFEFTAPASMFDEMPLMIKSALDNYFGLSTGFEQMDIPCLTLTAGKGFKPIPKATRQLVNTLNDKGASNELYGISQQLCDFLNLHLPVPVINGLHGELLDIKLPDGPLTIENMRAWLAPYGLELTPSIENMRVFVVSDIR